MSDWLTYSPVSGHGNGIITITADTLSTLEDRVATIIVSNSQYSLSASTSVTQKGVQLTAITFDNLTWVTDVPASGGTATKDNCSYSVYANYNNGTSYDITSDATVNGSLVVASTTATTRENVGTLTLTASYSGFTASSGVSVYQEEYVPSPTGASNYLAFEILTGGTIYWKASHSASTKTISYSKDSGDTWTDITSSTKGASISVNAGDVVMFKGDNDTYSVGEGFNTFDGTTAVFNLKGNIMSLINSDGFATAKTLTDSNTFYKLFYNCTGLVSAENLLLPATTLANYCYSHMFDDCTSLTTAPELPATTLASSCYSWMFKRCTSLITAPELPATTLAYSCYDHMFNGCTSLTTAPELPATTLADYCYTWMFAGCISLTTAPALPATTLARDCYSEMFYGCKSLTTAPALPATTLARDCCYYMFADCTSLTTAPSILPATALVPYCYYCMFRGCTSLTTAPALPATTLVEGCYEYMFDGCTKLNYIKCLATDISATDCTKYWVADVASTGTFVKNPNKAWTRGVDGIPKGWTVINDS